MKEQPAEPEPEPAPMVIEELKVECDEPDAKCEDLWPEPLEPEEGVDDDAWEGAV